MDIKKVFQYSLLLLLFLGSFLFYNKYFVADKKVLKKIETKKKEGEKNLVNQDQQSKNVIENLRYVSEDLLGNTYTLLAQSASLKEDKLNEVQLFEVRAEIKQKNQDVIYISSNTANYNKITNNTIFKENVNVLYGEQIIVSEILKLNFKDNLIEILDNINYINKDTKINADKVEIDLLLKKLKISMINKNDKVQITGKY
tara:strand:+ start:423 stop:1022 length:600 start_codon:yes stop_codon:yes gene_type:complete